MSIELLPSAEPATIKGLQFAAEGNLMATVEQKPAGVHTRPKTKVFKNFIGGEWVESRTGRTFENLNPADTREVVGILMQKTSNCPVGRKRNSMTGLNTASQPDGVIDEPSHDERRSCAHGPDRKST